MSIENVGNDVPQTGEADEDLLDAPDQVIHECHACGQSVDVLAIYDGRATDLPKRHCPECFTELRIIQLIADDLVDVEELEGTPGEELRLPGGFRQEIAERIEQRDDPAESNEYLRELGVVQ